MHLRLPACCPLEQLTFSNYGAIFLDDDFSWTLIYNQLKQHLQDCNSTVAMENFQSILGTEWLADPVIFTMIDCLKRGMPLPDSETARTMDPPSALRGGHDANKHPRSIDLEQVCILDSVVSRKILIALQTGDYADVLRIFKHECKFKTVKRILLPLNTSWEGITIWRPTTSTCTTGCSSPKTSTFAWQVGPLPCALLSMLPHTPLTLCPASSSAAGPPSCLAQALCGPLSAPILSTPRQCRGRSSFASHWCGKPFQMPT